MPPTPPSVAIFDEARIRRHVRVGAPALEAVERACTWLAEGRATMPPVMHIEVERGRGDVDIKSAYISGEDRFAIKVASGFFGNLEHGLPSGSGLMVVLSAHTGFCEALLLDNGYLTDLRTGLAGAVAAKYLAGPSLHTVGVVGSGTQARYQLQALATVRTFDRVLVFARDPRRMAKYCEDVPELVGQAVTAEIATSLEQLVRDSDCVITTTPSRQPLLHAAWLHPGLHITAMGSDVPGKQELDPDILRRADLVACDTERQTRRLGELQHLAPDDVTEVIELGALTTGRHPGRTDDAAITVCDLSGVGVQDTAIALFALEQMARPKHAESTT